MLEVPVPAANNVARLIELLRGTIDRDHSPLSPRIKLLRRFFWKSRPAVVVVQF
jgi:hypothetical protein